MIGVGSVFSREYYELCANRLNEDGLVCQWFHVYEMSDGIVGMVLRTFASVFPHVEIWDPGSGDILILGGKHAFKSSAETYREIYGRPAVAKDLELIGLKTPEAFWARQLASQRTGFAVPGPGPIQSDLFPVLEYEAPKAFFIGTKASLLTAYDERTHQSELAPAAKRTILASLDTAALREIFGTYNSVNSELNQFLGVRFAREEYPDGPFDDRLFHWVFRPSNAPAVAPPLPHSSSSELQRLVAADTAMRTNPSTWRESAAAIETILRANTGKNSQKLDWAPINYALAVAKTCLIHDDVERARSFVALGLQIDPTAHELLYLSRVLDRWTPQNATTASVR